MALQFDSNFDLMAECSKDKNVSGNLTMFCKTLVRHSQMKFARILICGSRMENPLNHAIAQMSNIDMKKLDSDKMFYLSSHCAVPRSRSVPEEYTGDIIRIYSEESHAGFVTLIKDKDNAELLWSEHVMLQDNDAQKHGPAFFYTHSMYMKTRYDTVYNFSNPTVNQESVKSFVITTEDIVCTIHSPYWPLEAAEWVARKRLQDIPSTRLIEQIAKYGCDFVPISHKLSVRESNEWRFSFSKAELLIIKSWTTSQRNVYAVLWLMNKKIEESHMCSYYFKTIMLWACEEKSSEFWREDNCALIHSVRELIIYMMACLKSKYLPNYFIPTNNMMDHLKDMDVLPDSCALWTAIKSFDISEQLKLGFDIMKSANATRYELPAWIKRSFIIYNRINNEEDNFSDLYSKTFQNAELNALHVELSDIHQSLLFQKQYACCDNTSEKEKSFNLAEFHLMRAVSQCKSDEMDTIENCNHIFVRSISSVFRRRETRINDVPISIPTSSTSDQKCLIRSVQPRYYQFEHLYCCSYSQWPGVSPTVNISWFIAKAYLANLYYTTGRKIILAREICDEIIRVHKDTYKNNRFAEKTFPVILSTQLVSIYDEEIQELIGFYSLCKYVWTESRSRSVYLGVCPVLFALYMKIRTDSQYALIDYLVHARECIYDCKYEKTTSNKTERGGRLLLSFALSYYRV